VTPATVAIAIIEIMIIRNAFLTLFIKVLCDIKTPIFYVFSRLFFLKIRNIIGVFEFYLLYFET
jgi:hypothetical protein